jgi:hypothetical protein
VKFNLSKDEVVGILELMNNFPQDTNYEFDYAVSAGIGHTLSVVIPISVKGHKGTFKIEITGPENW